MLDILKRFFVQTGAAKSNSAGLPVEHDVRVAVCALLVEIARIDETFSGEEMHLILSILTEKYGLSREHADALVAEAEKELEQSVDLWQFARLINANYTNDEKMEIIENLWRIVYVDGRMDGYEHYLMDKMQNLLRLSHSQLIAAKLKVLHPE
ncbi:MAG: TerB family tellurite resistance protein [Desulfobacterales bacterium]